MNYTGLTYHIFPLGDSALTLDFGNSINELFNKEVIGRFRELQKHPLPGMIEAVPAYSALTIYYDLPALRKKVPANRTVFDWIKDQLEERLQRPMEENIIATKLVKIPVCYEEEFAHDIQEIVRLKSLPLEEVIRIQTSVNYKVYMLGFLPGFAYMGEVDKRIAMPRKLQPEKVVKGSVGIAGIQTGIYPLASPGGWQIIGRTPLKLFDANSPLPSIREEASDNAFCLLHPGDTVQFYPITKNDFYEILNLPTPTGEGSGVRP